MSFSRFFTRGLAVNFNTYHNGAGRGEGDPILSDRQNTLVPALPCPHTESIFYCEDHFFYMAGHSCDPM